MARARTSSNHGERETSPPVLTGASTSNSWRRLFDRIVVVSLAGSVDRRAHTAAHLREFGVRGFEFFDATPADDPAVARATEAGEVLQYPPCFRCDKLDCGDPDCNNFLIPAQIATFISYRRLWRNIVNGEAERVLVMEDDVFLQPYAPAVLRHLENAVSAGKVPFVPGSRCLLRLGWALGAEHRGDMTFRVGEEVRMSNPCHALTRSFAAALIARDRGIVHTADVYIHRMAPKQGEAWTVFPPIAADMSWSVGSVDSTIHPKPVRSDWLLARGDHLAAELNDQRAATHVKKKHFRPLLLLGPPGGAVDCASEICLRLGVDVGRERLGTAGIASWALAVEADSNPDGCGGLSPTRHALAWHWLVLAVRDITQAAGAVIRDVELAPSSDEYRRKHILQLRGIDLNSIRAPLDRAVWTVTSWCRIVLDQSPDLIFRVEDGQDQLQAFLIAQGLATAPDNGWSLDTRTADASLKDRLDEPAGLSDWATLDQETLREISWYCATFGYAFPEGCRP